MGEKNTNKLPLGVKILGGLNCLLGFASLIRYFKITPEDFQKSLELFQNKNLPADITFEQFKTYNIVPMLVSFVFLVSGVGILLRKEWARKTTLYVSFSLAILIFVSILVHPAMVRLVGPQILYLGVIIVYFTNRKIENFFVPEKRQGQAGAE